MSGPTASGDAARGARSAVVPAAESTHEVLVAFGRALSFPEYYGVNLDALNDCLQDLASELANGEGDPLAVEWHVHPAFRRSAAFTVVKGILAGAASASEGTLTFRVVHAQQ